MHRVMSCQADLMDIYADWSVDGRPLRWRSTTAANAGRELTVVTHRRGTPGARPLVCVHGFPTSSIDFYALTNELAADFDIFLVDFPGYGASDKPQAPYIYSLYDDAQLLVELITEVWQLEHYTMLTHDRGDSIGLIALGLLGAAAPAELVITNGNVYLPLANLTAFQTALLDPATGRATAAAATPELLAAGLGASTFMPRRTPADPEIIALAKTFAYNDGIAVLPDTIAYLNERAAHETTWLAALSTSAVNTTLVWGVHDTIAPVRVANHVWSTALQDKPGRNRFWLLPGADHYPQCDAPAQLAEIIRLTVGGAPLPIQTIGDSPDGAVLVYG